MNIYDEKINKYTDWGGDDSTGGLPVSGKRVQEFIKDTLNTKISATFFDSANMTQYGFLSAEDRDNYVTSGDSSLIISRCPFEFTGVQKRIVIVNPAGSQELYFAENTGEAVITVGFQSQEKDITGVQWNDVVEDFTVSVWVDKGSTGSWIQIIENRSILYGNELSVDVYKYIQNGVNRVRISATGVLSDATSDLLFTVNRTSMYLSTSNFNWYRPFIEGEAYNLGGMNIGGSIPKVLHIKVSNSQLGYSKVYEENIGTKTYTNVAYYYTGLTFPETGSGTYNVDIWLNSSGLESEHLKYNIMFIASNDTNTAQLIAINEVSNNISNWTDSELFKYTIYDRGATTSSPSITITYNSSTLVDEILSNVSTSTINAYNASLEIDSEVSELAINATISLGETSKQITIDVDNSVSFPATSGSVFYLNAATRSNNQENKGNIINEVDSSQITMTTENIAYIDGVDGWTVDDEGRKCFFIPAGSKATIEYKPFATIGNAKTIEFCYKVNNVADYNENIITIATNPEDDAFRGIRIKSKNVCVHSRDKNTNNLAQSYNTKDEETVHVIITIIKNYKVNYGNLCQIYVNGVKKTSFSFTDTDSFITSANIVLGCANSDLYLYKIRMYNSGFGWQDAVQNYINCLPDKDSKVSALNKVIEVVDDSYNIDYDACVKAGYNTMVIEMKQGSLPDVLHPSSGTCDVTFNFPDVIESELDKDFKNFFSGNTLTDQVIDGQGTTSMTYYRWNFRWKLSKTYNKRRITAKKNYASSMHSHKMGCTRMYNDLHNTVVGVNDANARVAVFQYPAYGFLKTLIDGTTDQYVYTFIGLYTVGPDKGDRTTFGFNNPEFGSSIMDMEGTDHTPMGVGFDYPWNSMSYDYAKEGFGAITSNGSVAVAYEVGSAGSLSPDKAADQDAVWSMIESEFKPAYEAVYNNSTCILGVTDTLEAINSNISSWRSQTTSEGKPYSELEFWTDGVYDLYYFNTQSNRFESNGINLLTQLNLSTTDLEGLSLHEKNELFKSKRREKFKSIASNYWNIDDLLFHDTFLLLFGATDNGKKNTYPYKLKLLSDGGRWQWRQDDLDSVLDINNQGFAAKSYSLLYGDTTSSGSVFRGENSVLRTLVRECFVDETKQMVHRILDAMVSLSPYGSNKIDKLIGYVKENLWDKAQNYFSKSGYNADAEWSYEEAWPLKTSGAYVNDVDPLQQSLGDHYEAEKDWVELRMVFIASYFGWGPFAVDNGDDKSTGQVSFRAASGYTYSITPAIDFNPTILIGQSDSVSAGNRILAGNSTDIVVPDMGNNDTHIYIQGTDYLSNIGDLKDLQVSADNPVLNVSSKRMKILKVGDELAENVTSNVATLELGYNPCMEEIDARNLSTLTNSIDLSRLPRLRRALFKGTSSPNINISKGNKIEQLSLPDTITTLSLVSLPLLTEDTLDYGTLENISYLRVENNEFIDSFKLLKLAYTNSTNLSYIRIIGFDYSGTASDITMLMDLAEAMDENGNKKYHGIDAEGNADNTGYPIIEGHLHIAGSISQETIDFLKDKFPALVLTADQIVNYFKFVDPEVSRIVAENWGDGIGTTLEQIEAVTDIGTKFSNNSAITSFDEFVKFTNAQHITENAFQGDTSLRSIDLSKTKSIKSSSFYNCSSLNFDDLKLPELELLGVDAFYNVKIKNISDLGKITILPAASPNNQNFGDKSVLEELVLPDTVTTLPENMCNGYTSLTYCKLPNSISIIPRNCFTGCSSLSKIELPASVKELKQNCFSGCDTLSEINLGNIENISIGNHSNIFTSKNLPEHIIFSNLKTISSTTSAWGILNGTNVRKVEFPNLEQVSGRWCFNGTSMLGTEEIIIGENFKSWDGSYGDWLNLQPTLVIKAKTVPQLTGSLSTGKPNCIYVPDASVEAYKTATNWVNYADRIKSMFYYLGYIDFADPAVRDICVANFDTDRDGVVSIEEAAAVTDIKTIFQGNTEITSFDEFKYFTGVTTLRTAFNNCKSLKKVSVPAIVSSVSTYRMFNGCSALSDVVFNAETFGDQVLKEARSIKNVVLGSNVKTAILHSALENTYSPLNLYVGSGCNSISFSVGRDSALRSILFANIDVDAANTNYYSNDGCLYETSTNKLIVSRQRGEDEYTLPSFVSSLSDSAFAGTDIKKVIIPSNVDTSTNTYLFKGSLVEEAVFQNSMISLTGFCFRDCKQLKKVTYPSTLTTFKGGVFYQCTSLTKFTIEAQVIGVNSEGSYGVFERCTSLSALICLPENPPTAGINFIANTPIASGTGFIYVPDDSVDAYKAATNWSTYTSQIKPINVADTLPDISTVAENDLYKIGEVYWKAEMVDNVLTWVEI